ncbi:hypothetical protein [Flavobacterium sp. NRK1]|uniref:hypothetical protein n=1 Tax=Flavobacterium sp. NRK1 TaxID=2954929 RepID=UPI0020936B37|nr:hypothetical protein [Flavobacterium sp. NRK1]MCO6149092.1 hypothetical protein [Flavobacterium sp. NRK1]
MKNNICISPVDNEMASWGKAVWLLNEYRGLGFKTRQSFIRIISEKLPKYNDVDSWNQLGNFWLGRVKDDSVNRDVETVLEQLKSE